MSLQELQHIPPQVVGDLSQSDAVQFDPAYVRVPVHCKDSWQVSLELEGGALDMILVATGGEK